MQDAATRQKTGPRFVISATHETEVTLKSHFEIKTDSLTHRENLIRGFENEEPQPTSNFGSAVTHSLPSKPGKGAAELLLNAQTLLNHGEKDLARVLIYESLNKDSRNPLALKKAKLFLDPIKDLHQLIQIQKVICLNELSFESYSELAQLYYRQGNDEAALKYYSESLNLVISETESLFDVYKNMGNIMTRAGDFDGAEEYFHKAFTINPQSDVLAVNLGTLAIQQGDYQTALTRFRSAVQSNPKNDKAWVGLALVHHQMGDIQLAFANIETAIDLQPDNRTAVHLFANWCFTEGKFQNAIEVIQNYLSFVDTDEDLSLVLVHLFCKINRFDLAKLEAERVLLWNPQHVQMNAVFTELTSTNLGNAR